MKEETPPGVLTVLPGEMDPHARKLPEDRINRSKDGII
jgi:hypothetical protein